MQAELTNTSNKTYFKVEFSGKTQTVSVQKLFHKLKAPFLGNWEKLIKLKATYHSINTSHIIFGTLPTKIFVFTSICLEFGSSKCWYLLTLEKTTGCQTRYLKSHGRYIVIILNEGSRSFFLIKDVYQNPIVQLKFSIFDSSLYISNQDDDAHKEMFEGFSLRFGVFDQ